MVDIYEKDNMSEIVDKSEIVEIFEIIEIS